MTELSAKSDRLSSQLLLHCWKLSFCMLKLMFADSPFVRLRLTSAGESFTTSSSLSRKETLMPSNRSNAISTIRPAEIIKILAFMRFLTSERYSAGFLNSLWAECLALFILGAIYDAIVPPSYKDLDKGKA